MISGFNNGHISGIGTISFNAPSGSSGGGSGGGGGGNAYDDASLKFHLDATSSSNFTFSSGNNISSWNDLLGNYNFTSIGGNGTNASYATWNSTLKAVRFSESGYGQWNGYPGSNNPAICITHLRLLHPFH